MISPDLQSVLESGVSILIGTRDAGRMPAVLRAFGARVENAGKELVVFLPAATAATTIANLRDNGRIAVCFARIPDHFSVQVKGRLLDLRPAAEGDRAWIDRHRHALSEALAFIGMPPATLLRVAHWPSQAVRIRVEHLFVQTPGPRAGEPLGAARPEAHR